MSVRPVINAKLYLAQFDISGSFNSAMLDNGFNQLDGTTFGHTANRTVAGLFRPRISGSGFIDLGVGLSHQAIRSKIAVIDTPMTVSPESGAVGERAEFTTIHVGTYTPGAAVGQIFGFNFEALGQGLPLVGGKVFIAAGAKMTSGNSGTALQLGPVLTGQKIYAALHVLAASGGSPSLTVTVKSDNAVGFGSPVTVLTFTTATGVTSEWKQADGPLTDDYWRVDYTIAGTTPSFSFVVAVGIT